MKFSKYILGLIFILLVSCSYSSNKDQKITTTSYPPPNLINKTQFAYPFPTTDYSSQFPTITSNPESGILEFDIYNDGKPVSFYNFYLATVMKDPKTGLELSTSLDRTKAPHALSNKGGEVVFGNVPPGRYGIMIIIDISSYLLLNPKDGSTMFITVENNSRIDLGRLDYSDLPIN